MRAVTISPVIVPPVLELFMLAGQSNMSGKGLLEEAPSFPFADKVDVFSNAWTWVAGAEPVDSAVGQIDTVSSDASAAVGPSMAFANRLAELRQPNRIGLVPCAKGGSSLADWSRNLSRSTLYGSFIARGLKAAERGVLTGILWYQGEAETRDASNANTTKERTEALFANFRADLGIPDLPIINTILGPNPGDTYWTVVQAQQAAITGDRIISVSAADLTGKPGDTIHLNTASQMILGKRYAEAMHALLTNA